MARIQMWKTEAPGGKGSPAAQVCELLVDNLPDASSFTFIDSCAGVGAPFPSWKRRSIRNCDLKVVGLSASS